jgi:hypothetical protein
MRRVVVGERDGEAVVEIHLLLDDGTEIHLTRGDCVVVTGQRHAWSNRSGSPCTLSTTSIGARRT